MATNILAAAGKGFVHAPRLNPSNYYRDENWSWRTCNQAPASTAVETTAPTTVEPRYFYAGGLGYRVGRDGIVNLTGGANLIYWLDSSFVSLAELRENFGARLQEMAASEFAIRFGLPYPLPD
jgi:hypothetical protein